MKLYADLGSVRRRQIVLDAALVLWVVVWVALGAGLYGVVDDLRVAGDTTEDAGSDLAARMDGIAEVIGGVPLVGDQLRRPFSEAAGAGRTLEDAGARSSDAVHRLAIWLGVLLAGLPILWVSSKYVPGRVRWVRDATAVADARLDNPATVDVLAWRAAVALPLADVMPLADDRVALARLELRRLGMGS